MERPPGAPRSFDVRTIVYLRRGTNPPDLGEEASTALHHAHLAYLTELAQRGIIAANGPLLDQSDETMRGMSVYTQSTPSRRGAWPSRTPPSAPDASAWTLPAGP